MLYDLHGRRVNYLRISLTARCNFRCIYCNPNGVYCAAGSGGEMGIDELSAVAQAAAAAGIEKIRLTGGEPLLYAGLTQVISGIRKNAAISDLSLTTNGSLLASCAADLAAAGLTRVNISLDSLQEERFRRITGGGSLRKVLQGIEAAKRAGLAPLKINTVVMRGINDDEVGDFARLAQSEGLDVRFIEYMPFGPGAQAWQERFMSMAEVEAICRRYVTLDELKPESGPATSWRIRASLGSLGFIAPFHCDFCAGCNRLRLTADGKLRPCLFSDNELDIRPALQQPEKIVQALAEAVRMKGKSRIHSIEQEGDLRCGRQMFQIGG